MPSSFINSFQSRGFFHQCTDLENLDKQLATDGMSAYIGFDCTAPSLHVGSLMQIMILRLLQQHGIKPIVLIGGGTTKVGDPSFKDEARKMLDDEAIAKNSEGIKAVLQQFIHFGEGQTDAVMVNNAEWLDKLNYMEFLRDYGRYFSVNRMLGFDSVKLRLEREQNLSFLEFNYMLLQAYDFIELYRQYGCRLQIGGSDQWGNIVNGVELQRRLGREAEIFGLTTPLITTASGAKMGKTVGGAVWLSASLLSAYDYWQFWRNTEDGDVGRFLRFFTELPEHTIQELEQLKDNAINEAKKILAFEATKLCHGEAAAQAAAETARKLFEEKGAGEGLHTVEIPISDMHQGMPAYILFHRAGLVASGGEARRLIRGGGAKVNDVTVTDESQNISIQNSGEQLKLSAGKKHHVLVKVSA